MQQSLAVGNGHTRFTPAFLGIVTELRMCSLPELHFPRTRFFMLGRSTGSDKNLTKQQNGKKEKRCKLSP